MTTDGIELASFFEQAEFNAGKYAQFADAAHESFQARERFSTLLNEYRDKASRRGDEALKVALGSLMLGKFGEALDWFARSTDNRVRHYYAAEAALGLNRFAEALTELREAASGGWDAFETDMRSAAVHVRAGEAGLAEKLLRKREAEGASRAEWHYVKGLLAEAGGDQMGAGQAYEKALELEPEHTGALFRCARLYDLCGSDEWALELYDRLARQPRAHINALMNAAVVYEDRGRYDEAALCLSRVLKAYPNHTRARLFLKSVDSCRLMVIRDTGEQPIDPRTRLLATPLSEFELSVRARNCLKKMNVRTLSDLMRLSEPELLAYKNFGETSLNEIKALLTKRGLHLGMQPEEVAGQAGETTPVPAKPALPPGQEAVLAKPVAELELSVRSRRCLQRLNVHTLGDLIQLSEAELLSTRNFGVTSLTEVQARLAEHGLQLAVKRPA